MAAVNAAPCHWIASPPVLRLDGDAARPTQQTPPPQADGSWAFAPGDTLAPGRRVIRRLGHGGIHEAFLVEDGASGHAVAKLPRPSLAHDPHRLVSLRDEGRALSRLVGPGVPRHLDAVLSGPYPHLLLEYIAGPTLHTAAARPLPAPLVASIGWDLTLALEGIARAGWVHLDVKPSNIIVNARPRLLDFELAQPASAAASLPEPTGTWNYMPPEQRAAGRPGAPPVGPAADVFALAVSLGEALTGRPLVRARRPMRIAGQLGAVLTNALAPAPADRPTAAELAAELTPHVAYRAGGTCLRRQLRRAHRRDHPPARRRARRRGRPWAHAKPPTRTADRSPRARAVDAVTSAATRHRLAPALPGPPRPPRRPLTT